MEQQALRKYWTVANQQLTAKLISELAYEQAFSLMPSDDDYQLTLASGVTYQFTGKKNIWGQVNITPQSLIRHNGNEKASGIEASQFMLDAFTELVISDETLAEHLEDLYATLLGDCKLLQIKEGMTAFDIAAMPLAEQQCLFNGHPKFAFNKGRRGWGSDDLRQFAPEARRPFQLYWLAVHHSLVDLAVSPDTQWQQLLASSLGIQGLEAINERLHEHTDDPEQFVILPVHPWQWEKKLSLLYGAEIARGDMLFLGAHGDDFLPQLSLRTLTNVSHPQGYDIKLPLTIMNTSCYRGIPGHYMMSGPLASDWLQSLCVTDPLLKALGTEVLKEPASAFIGQSVYQQLPKAPYRYHELLGVIWRESAATKLAPNESTLLMAALMETGNQGQSVLGAYVQASHLSAEDWLSQLFKVVVIPFYHLLVKFGVSLIAHGQNITLVMKDHVPQRILLKDFQGDMRLVERDIPEHKDLDDGVKAAVLRLPEKFIIHDLQTGHFVTVLRFISPLVTSLCVSETRFYRLLGDVIQDYMKKHPELEERFKRLDLFTSDILRVSVNLAKFRHKTDDSAERMLPVINDRLDNPLYMVSIEQKALR